MGKNSTPAVKETPQEKQQAADATRRWAERKDDGYLELEKQQIAESNRDMSGFFAGRSSADIAEAERKAYQTARPNEAAFSRVGDSVGTAVAKGASDAATENLKYGDGRRLNVVKIGNDVAGDTSQVLGATAKLSSARAVEDLENQTLENNARFSAGMQVLGAGINGAAASKAGYSLKTDGVHSPSKVVYSDDDPFGSGKQVGDKKLGYGALLGQI